MRSTIDLSEGAWTVTDLTAGDAPVPATVPGCVHTALQAAGRFGDFAAPATESATAWIGEHDWAYHGTFSLPATFFSEGRIELVAERIDPLGTLFVNGARVGETDNAFRTWRWSVGEHLKTGHNRIEVRLASPMGAIRRAAGSDVQRDDTRVAQHVSAIGWLRRMACNHGWDWAPRFPTLGVGALRLERVPDRRLTDVHFRQFHQNDGSVVLNAQVTCLGIGSDERIDLRINGEVRATAAPGDKLSTRIPNPSLWWPRGLGGQPLHEVAVELKDARGNILDTARRRIGFRRIELAQEADRFAIGRSFSFIVNGHPVFAKGANWVPADLFPHRLNRTDLELLLRTAVDTHMNMIRVWGGGIYESTAFYELCDELGLLVWQDFMFSSAIYPAYDDAFLQNVAAEAQEQIARLRHHACLALWCGNNEIEHNFVGSRWGKERRLWTDTVMARRDYDRLFREVLGGSVAQCDPDTPYISASPHDPVDPTRWPGDQAGDNHYWDAWFWGVPFASQRSSRHRFVSEFGFQSLPGPAQLQAWGLDLSGPPHAPAVLARLAHHQRCKGADDLLRRYVERECGGPGASLRAYAWRTQFVQGLALQSGVDHWRASGGRTRGALIWQLNDIWPSVSWSLLDAQRKPKLSLTMLRLAFAPLALVAFEDVGAQTMRLVALSDRIDPVTADVRWTVYTTGGNPLESRVESGLTLPPDGSCFDLGTIELLHHARAAGGPGQIFVHYELLVANEVVFENCAFLVRPKEVVQPSLPVLTPLQTPGVDGLLLTTDVPAFWVTDGTDLFHLLPRRPRRIRPGRDGVCPPFAPLLQQT